MITCESGGRVSSWLTIAFAISPVLGPRVVAAETGTVPLAVDLTNFQRATEKVFSSAYVTNPEGAFVQVCDRLMLVAQGISVLLIVAGMLHRIRRHQVQMEGVASMMLKVAFIATIPFWRSLVLETADSIAGVAGFESCAGGAHAPASLTQTWALVREWTPPGSPYLDVLQSQSSANVPASGQEETWGLQAWNWAKGVGVGTEQLSAAMWRTFGSGLRAGIVFVTCAAMAFLGLVNVFLACLAEIIRSAAFVAGCAAAPVFVAGLGVDLLRGQASRFLFRLGAIALWPTAWALLRLLTTPLNAALLDWMHGTCAAAMSVGDGAAVPTVAVASPYLAWSSLLVLAAATGCVGSLGIAGLVGGPLVINRLVTAGAQFGGAVASELSIVVNRHDAPAPVPPRPIASSPARMRHPFGAGGGSALACPGGSQVWRKNAASTYRPRSRGDAVIDPPP